MSFHVTYITFFNKYPKINACYHHGHLSLKVFRAPAGLHSSSTLGMPWDAPGGAGGEGVVPY